MFCIRVKVLHLSGQESAAALSSLSVQFHHTKRYHNAERPTVQSPQ